MAKLLPVNLAESVHQTLFCTVSIYMLTAWLLACRWRVIWKHTQSGTLLCAAACCVYPSCTAVSIPKFSMGWHKMLYMLPLPQSRSVSLFAQKGSFSVHPSAATPTPCDSRLSTLPGEDPGSSDPALDRLQGLMLLPT